MNADWMDEGENGDASRAWLEILRADCGVVKLSAQQPV